MTCDLKLFIIVYVCISFFGLLTEEGGILEASKFLNKKILSLDYKKYVVNQPTVPNLFNLLDNAIITLVQVAWFLHLKITHIAQLCGSGTSESLVCLIV